MLRTTSATTTTRPLNALWHRRAKMHQFRVVAVLRLRPFSSARPLPVATNEDGDNDDHDDHGRNSNSKAMKFQTATATAASKRQPIIERQIREKWQQHQQQLSPAACPLDTSASNSIGANTLRLRSTPLTPFNKTTPQPDPGLEQDLQSQGVVAFEGSGSSDNDKDSSSVSFDPQSHPSQQDAPNQQNEKILRLSPAALMFTGSARMPITTTLHLVTPREDTPRGVWPVFRLMNESGAFRDPARDGQEFEQDLAPPSPLPYLEWDRRDLDELRSTLCRLYPHHESELEASALLKPNLHVFPDTQSVNTLMRAYRQMIRLREMDTLLQNAQRQGRIAFYMTCRGEEAIHMGAASALDLGDPIFAQYREQGLLMWRGFSLDQFTNHCFATDLDLGKGRQMPVHYGSRALNYHTISSPLGTQMPQAVGAAYRLKLAGKPNVAICFFGEGASSTIDFHSALNFAATLASPVIFFCRNNGYAISTPVTEQYAGDGIISRAPGYGMAGLRVDGNDVFAVHAAVREAKRYALQNKAPVLIEAMTYRQGHHSTSDDSTSYRSAQEVEEFASVCDPVKRLEAFLQHYGWLSDQEIATTHDEEKWSVLQSIKQAEQRPKPPLRALFEDVYCDMPPRLQQQMADLQDHLAKYPNKYK